MRVFFILASLQHRKTVEESLKSVFAAGDIHSWQENAFSARIDGRGTASIDVFHRDGDEDFDEKHLHSLRAFYFGLDYDDAKTATFVRMQLAVVNTVIVINTTTAYEPREDDPWYRALLGLTAAVSGIARLEDGCLLDKTGQVIVFPDGKKGDADFQPVAAEKMVIGTPFASEEGRIRKSASMEKLKALGIRTIDHLPELPPSDVASLPTRLEIAQRAATVLIIIQFACDVAYEQMAIEDARRATQENLEKYGLKRHLTKREKMFLSAPVPDRTEATQIIWHYEACWVLMWALHLVDELPFPNSICNTQTAIAILFSCPDFRAFYNRTKVRGVSKILDEADLNYRYNWACTQSRLDGEEPAAEMNASVIIERKRAFDWLFGLAESDWDVMVAAKDATGNALVVKGEILIDGVTHCAFRSHEDILEDDSYCFYGYETLPGARIDMWGNTVAFRAQVSPKGTPIVLKKGELETCGALTRLHQAESVLEECQEALAALQEQAMPKVDASHNLEIQKHYDAKGLFEQIQAFAAIRANKELAFAQQCEQFVPVFFAMTRIVKEAAANMPEALKQEDNAYGMTLFQLYAQVAGVRGRVEKEGLSLSDAFIRAAYDLQLAVEEAYEDLAETEEYEFSEAETAEIERLKQKSSDSFSSFETRVDAARRLWEDTRLDVSDRIDYVDAIIDLATDMIHETDNETKQLMDGLAVAESGKWKNPEPAIAAINHQVTLLKEMQGAMTGPFISLLTESPMRGQEEKSATQQAMGFVLDAVEVAVRESEVTGAFGRTMALLFRHTPPGQRSHAIRVWLDDGLVTGILPSWK